MWWGVEYIPEWIYIRGNGDRSVSTNVRKESEGCHERRVWERSIILVTDGTPSFKIEAVRSTLSRGGDGLLLLPRREVGKREREMRHSFEVGQGVRNSAQELHLKLSAPEKNSSQKNILNSSQKKHTN